MLSLWLPLNGNTTQQGVSSSTVSNVTATVDNSGKIGKCYSFSGSQHVAIPEVIIPSNTTAWSFACWFYLANTTSSSATCLFSERTGGNAAGYTIFIYPNNSSMLVDDGARWQVTPMTFTAQTWYHLVVTRDSTGKKIYINGELKSSTTTIGTTTSINSNGCLIGKAQNSTALTNGDQGFIGKLNDVRVYVNHALSPKEIEILSRGLVCHYPLNNNGGGQPNLYDFESDANKWAEDGLTRRNYTDDVYGNVLKVSSSSTQSSNFRIYREVSNVWNSGQTYTVSFLAKASKSATVRVSRSVADYAPNFTVDTTWKRYSGQINCTTTATGGTLSIQLATLSTDLYITQVKLELGDKATVYCPGVGDSHYIPLGYDSTTEYDVSGYQNNMTKTGTITYTSDSARYSVSSHFINGSYLIANQNSTDYLPKDAITVNVWIKPTTWGTVISCTEGGGWNIEESGSGLQFQCYISGVGYKPAKCSVTGSSLVDSKWHMLTGVFDRAAQQTKFYIDGELKGSNATGSNNGVGYVSNRLIISGEAQSTTPASSYFVGEESDVRIYATALSAAQVAELYNTAVSVANNGTLMGYELVES